MKHIWKKTAAFVLAVPLVVGAMPANIGLGGFWGETAIVANAAGVSDAVSFTSAVQSGGTITLDADIALTETLWLENNEDIVIDLNGHTLSTTENFAIFAPITVTIRDSVGNGKISGTAELSLFNIVYSGSLLLESGTLECKNCSEGRGGIAVGNSTAGKGSLIVNGGVIDSASHAIWLNNGNVTINGGTFIGDFIDETGDLTITGGTFSFDPSNFLDENYTANQNGNYWTVGEKDIAYDDVATIPGEVRDISGSPEATGENNQFDLKIENASYLPTLLSLESWEVEQGVNAWFGIDSSENILPTNEVQGKFQELADNHDYSIGKYFDLSLYKKVGNNPSTNVEETNGDVEVCLTVPQSEDYEKATSFGLIREHNDAVEWIAVEYNDITKEIKFKTDKFSTYALVYEESAAITSASVTLGDDLALNFYVDNVTAETASEYTVNFTGASVDESSALAYNATEGKYYATTHVYAKDIDKSITATLCKGDDTVDTVEDYSISKYLSSDAFSGADEKTSALITATKDFGNATSEYFYGTGSGYSDGFASYDPDTSAYATTFDSDDAKLSLVLDSKSAARLYVNGDDTGTESTISSTKADYPTYHEVTGLLPQNLADEQTITVDGTDYTFSALTWCYRVLNNTSASTKNVNMAKAIMAYYTAAANYTDNTIQLAVGDLNFTYTEGQTWNDITLPDGVGIDSENHIIYNNRILSYNSSGAWVTADTEIGSPAGYYWETIYVDSVTLDKSTLTLAAGGDTATLTATVLPDNATDKTVTWSSDNEAVATVVDGVVTPISKGTATITATSGGKSDTCTVTVRQLYSFTLTGPYTGETLVVEYYEGDTWNDMVAKYPNTLKVYYGYVAFGTDGFIYPKNGDFIPATAQIDPNETYVVE